MPSNDYPNPPSLSSAKDLFTPTPPKEEVPVPEETVPKQSLPTPEVVPETPLAVKDSVPETPDTVQEVLHEESSAHGNSEIETVETEVDDRDYGGPWGIIKHTGYATVAVWSVLTAAATGAAAYFFAPGDHTWILGAVLGFMTGLIAAVDRKTHLIKNQHIIATAILTVPLAVVIAFMFGPWNLFFGILSSVIIFSVFIFLVIKKNFGSGGDIKFSPVPAFALGVINPLVPVLWLFYSMIATLVLLIIRKQTSTSFGEGMAISLPLALASVCGLYALLGMPYLEPLV